MDRLDLEIGGIEGIVILRVLLIILGLVACKAESVTYYLRN